MPLLVANGSGLVIEVTDGDSDRYRGSLFYDLAKASAIRLAVAQASELAAARRGRGLAHTRLPALRGDARPLRRTEATWRDGIAQDPHFALSETPAYVGRAAAALAADPDVMRWNGRALSSWVLAREYGFRDDDGSQPDWGRWWDDVWCPGASIRPARRRALPLSGRAGAIPSRTRPHGRSGSGRLVEEAEHAGDAAVVLEHRDVEADREGLAAGCRDELPREARDVVVGVDAAVGEPEDVARHLLLDRSDELADLIVAGDVGERVDVLRPVGVDVGDRCAPGVGVGLVPGVEIALDELFRLHVVLLSGRVSRPRLPALTARVDDLRGNESCARRLATIGA